MLFPYPVIDPLTPDQVRTWNEHFSGIDFERPRSIEEGIWRRTQDAANAAQSGWSQDCDGRRRVVHYRYHYDLDHTHPMPRLVLSSLYLATSLRAPAREIDTYLMNVSDWLTQGRWRTTPTGWQRGDLQVTVTRHQQHPQDVRADRATPQGFASLDVVFSSEGYRVPRSVACLPWDVLARGPRMRQERGTPTYAPDLSGILDVLPFQVEIGCGTSIEAGIPPLHYLHEVYRVTQRTDNALTQSHPFTMRPDQDTLVQEMLLSPEDKADELVSMFAACFNARPTAAHRSLKTLADAGYLVGPVINHNFDVLAARAGLAEQFVRRYDQKYPDIEWGEGVRSLLVIGLHADRRAVQERARARGLPVFYVDTEGLSENGVFREYLVEGARAGDTIVRQDATTALARLCELLNLNNDSPVIAA
ncbi:SIR2 family protein [Nocardiopsis dassonvillei]|uniref:hypothetical protein n=1 Tax=Nocardiopsis dassonvillei TaxID=2014 RepID=UPI0036435A2D